MPAVQFESVTKQYPNAPRPAVDGVSLAVEAGEFVVLLGPSGCGKTTLLKMVNRLIEPSSGRILVDGQDVANVPVTDLRRHIGYVIQNVGLFPHMTVARNVSVVPRLLGRPDAEIQARTDTLLTLVGLDPAEYRDRYPSQLSGGQQQRVGLARALSADPKLLLMDEPFGALDALTRGVIQDELVNIVDETQQTVFMITHDIDEAILLADRIFLMSNGPRAFLAEIVENTIPKPRHRDNIHHHAHYYKIRNHLLDFLVHRSKALQQQSQRPSHPKVINFSQMAWDGL